jgi:hypothetical protein
VTDLAGKIEDYASSTKRSAEAAHIADVADYDSHTISDRSDVIHVSAASRYQRVNDCHPRPEIDQADS